MNQNDVPEETHAPRRRNWFTLIAAFTVILATVGSFEVARTAGVAQAESRYTHAVEDTRQAQAAAQASVASVEEALAAGRAALDSSAGHTLDDSARTALSSELDKATELRDAAAADIAASQKVIDAGAPSNPTFEQDLNPALNALQALTFTRTGDLDAAVSAITGAISNVTAAVDAWNAEQARIAA